MPTRHHDRHEEWQHPGGRRALTTRNNDNNNNNNDGDDEDDDDDGDGGGGGGGGGDNDEPRCWRPVKRKEASESSKLSKRWRSRRKGTQKPRCPGPWEGGPVKHGEVWTSPEEGAAGCQGVARDGRSRRMTVMFWPESGSSKRVETDLIAELDDL